MDRLVKAVSGEGLDPKTYVSDFYQPAAADTSEPVDSPARDCLPGGVVGDGAVGGVVGGVVGCRAAGDAAEDAAGGSAGGLVEDGAAGLAAGGVVGYRAAGGVAGGVVGDDAASVVSRSSVSTRGSSASRRSVASIRALEAAKRAELQTRASFLEEKREMEEEELLQQLEVQKRKARQEMELKEMELRQKLKTQRKKEELRIRQQLAEADARENAVKSIEEQLIRSEEAGREIQLASLNVEAPIFQPARQFPSEVNMFTTPPTRKMTSSGATASMCADPDVQQREKQHDEALQRREAQSPTVGAVEHGVLMSQTSRLSQSEPHPPGFQKMQTNEVLPDHPQEKSSIEELLTRQNLVMKSLMNQQMRGRLPKLEMVKFAGNVTEYAQFTKSFDSNIGSKLVNDEERLAYLDQYLVGEPKELIRGCLLMSPSEGYSEARGLLYQRYGDPYRTVAILINKIMKWPSIKSDDSHGLDKFSMFLSSCHSTAASGASSLQLDPPSVLRSVLDKLPHSMQDRWRRKAVKIRDSHGNVKFQDLVSYVAEEARVLSDPLFGKQTPDRSVREAQRSEGPGQGRSGRVMATSINSRDQRTKCWFCREGHLLEDCATLRAKPMQERREFILKNALCYGCLRKGHRVSVCSARKFCKLCKGRHPTLLHEDRDPASASQPSRKTSDESETQVKNGSVGMTQSGSKLQSSMPVIPVKVRIGDSKTVSTYAFLDSGSSACFCTESLLAALEAGDHCTPTRLTLETVNPEVTKMKSLIINGVQVSDLEESSFISLPATYTLDRIPVSRDDIPTSRDMGVWPHLRDLELHDIDSEVCLMIGNNVPEAMEPWDVIHGNAGEPFAVKTKLGWVVNGPMKAEIGQNIRFNRVRVKEDVHEMFVKMYNDEFRDENMEGKGMSLEDLVWLNKVESACERTCDNHYQIPLPFREENVQLPDNLQMASKRLEALKRKLCRDERLLQDYTSFMDEMLKKGYAEEVPEEATQEGKVWYLPHHGVRHPQKPEKLRVVFDCAAKFHDTSLNDRLLQGPDLANDLLDVLMRFREGAAAFTADVEAMFYQVKVPSEDRDFLRFLWWPEGDLKMRPKAYRMTVHLFGACSSPSCASYALKRTAKDHGMLFQDDAAQTVSNNFYVDDCLKSGQDQEDVTALAHGVKQLCALGGFNLTKFMSNDRQLLNSFPNEERGKEVKAIDLSHDELPETKALGVVWIPEDDELVVRTGVMAKEPTRRGILATVSSVYDPLGIVAPFVLSGRTILQELCRLELGWDQILPLHLEDMWKKWVEALPMLAEYRIDRCLIPRDFGECVDAQVHHFSDASEKGFGSVAYLRLTNAEGRIWCSFLCGKARVAPLKAITIPRLELVAAVMAVRINKRIEKAMDLSANSTHFWSDSMTVINYIRNTKTRFHVFVANRLKMIHDGSSISQWRYIPGSMNPADEASRGHQTERWLRGPEFLWKPESEWPHQPFDDAEVLPSDPEVKANSLVVKKRPSTEVGDQVDDEPNTVGFQHAVDPVQKLAEHYSSWYRLKKAVAWLMRARNVLQAKAKSKTKPCATNFTGELTVEELEAAAKVIIKSTQKQVYGEEMAVLEKRSIKSGQEVKGCHVKKSSPLRNLDPLLDDGLLRVGGRLRASTLEHGRKHPLILPGDSHVARLIIEDTHRQAGHQGREHVLAALRERFWVTKGNTAVRRVLRTCVRCKRLQAPVCSQKMSDLPEERMESELPPFTNSGVDLFGPFYVKRGEVKPRSTG